MILKKGASKAKNAVKIAKNEGILTFLIISLQKLQLNGRKKSVTAENKQDLDIKVMYNDVINAQIGSKKNWIKSTKKTLSFAWIMPPPGKGSGGHMNIFRFIKFLEDSGHSCQIYLYTKFPGGPIKDIYKVMDGYPDVKAEMKWLTDEVEIAGVDGIFATSWETAYASYSSKSKAKRFYFVQDFEPYFYPMGSMYVLAENTYKMGFYGITAGGWLSAKLSRDYSMRADHFDFGSDSRLYNFANNKKRKEILFYARPFTERRGFELGIMVLDIFHKLQPDYKINMVGWDVSNYAIPFPYENLKTLRLEELNELYNRCAAGLVLSFTNMSLLPLELLSSGTIPVVNDGENNRLVSDNKFIEYVPSDPYSLAMALSKTVSKKDSVSYARLASKSVSTNSWSDSGEKFVKLVESEARS